MKTVWTKIAVVLAVAAPIGVLAADDEKKSDTKTATATVTVEAQAGAAAGGGDDQKRVEVRVLRLDGKDGGTPEIKILQGEQGSKPLELKVLGLDGADGKAAIRVFVDGQAVGEKAEKQTYLGVAVEPVPAALAAHLPGVLTKDQGLLVTDVAPDSPAGKAGLKEHDVVVSLDDQKLFSAEQLTKLVRGEKPGRDVTLTIVRGGKVEKVKATLAEREMPRGMHVLAHPGAGHEQILELKNLFEGQGLPNKGVLRGEILKKLEEKGVAPGGKAGGVKVQSSFSSMKLESLDGDRFKAEIEFKNEKGDKLKRSFEGTRDEIKKQIEADKEMPDAIRNQLMHSLDFGKGGKGAFHFNMPKSGFWIDTDSDAVPAFAFPAGKNLDQIIDQFSDNLDAETKEKLKGALRSIEEPNSKPAPRERPL